MTNLKNKTTKCKQQTGFTLVELLVVIMIIAILSGLVLGVLNSQGIRSKGTDSQRKADLASIQTALELFFADNRHYPLSTTSGENWLQVTDCGGTNNLVTELCGTYINNIPVDPAGETGTNAGPCGTDTFHRYNYRSFDTGSGYLLTSIMEIDSSNEDSPCSDLNNWSESGCTAGYATEDVCYGVENPR